MTETCSALVTGIGPGRQPVAGGLSIDDGSPQQENIETYLEADLLDDYGFAGVGRTRAARAGRPRHRDGEGSVHRREPIALLWWFDAEESSRS